MSLGAIGSKTGNYGYVTQREVKLPTRTSLLKAASQPTGMLEGLLLSILCAGNRSPLSALLLIVLPIEIGAALDGLITLADDVPGPIGRKLKPSARKALLISHAPITPLRRPCERGKVGDSTADRFAGMAGTCDACELDIPLPPSETP